MVVFRTGILIVNAFQFFVPSKKQLIFSPTEKNEPLPYLERLNIFFRIFSSRVQKFLMLIFSQKKVNFICLKRCQNEETK